MGRGKGSRKVDTGRESGSWQPGRVIHSAGWERESRGLCTDLKKSRGAAHSTRPRRGLLPGPLGE